MVSANDLAGMWWHSSTIIVPKAFTKSLESSLSSFFARDWIIATVIASPIFIYGGVRCLILKERVFEHISELGYKTPSNSGKQSKLAILIGLFLLLTGIIWLILGIKSI